MRIDKYNFDIKSISILREMIYVKDIQGMEEFTKNKHIQHSILGDFILAQNTMTGYFNIRKGFIGEFTQIKKRALFNKNETEEYLNKYIIMTENEKQMIFENWIDEQTFLILQ